MLAGDGPGEGGDVINAEAAVLADALSLTSGVFGGDTVHLATIAQGRLDFVTGPAQLAKATWKLIGQATSGGEPISAPTPQGGTVAVLPVLVDGRVDALLIVERPTGGFGPLEQGLLTLISRHVGLELQNTQLAKRTEILLSDYMSAEIAQALLADPDVTQLGGRERDITVLFADLTGFTTFSEQVSPAEVVEMLNRYFGVALPVIADHGGTLSALIGDALMALFNATEHQPDHPLLGATAALDMQRAVAEMIATVWPTLGPDVPPPPRFRVGVNTGLATIGNVGSTDRRVFTAIGDTVNLASRLEGVAPPGQVVIGHDTYLSIRPVADVEPLGEVEVKGKSQPVQAWLLKGLKQERFERHTVNLRVGWQRP